jgi:hypothetical protein
MRSGLMERLGVGEATPWEMLWSAEWLSPMATAPTVQNQAPERYWSFR